MANPTTNFGWVMPTSTDLVTDLPADFNVFGQGVDTSMQYLLGGTTGQVLSKTSGTNMAFTWVTPTDQTPLTTKGDLFTFTTVDARLPVGTTGQILSADPAAATGLAWITNDIGDITSVNVTSPITGGGTSGAVTIAIQDALTTQKGSVQLSDSTSTTSSVLAATPTAVKSAYDLATAAIAKSTVTTAGDIIYRNATVPARLGIGTAGQVLTVNSGATAPEWTTASAGALTKIANTTWTATTAVNVNNCFSATYSRYRILIKNFAASGQDITYMKLRVGGVDNSAAQYYYGTTKVSWAAASSAIGGSGLTTGFYCGTGVAQYTLTSIDIGNPFVTTATSMNYLGISDNASVVGAGEHFVNSSFDGFSLLWASGTFTGEVVIYGYSN